ncbi:7-carboxy-7-deazaguanine synthase [hydrothermal vent metagenome]|uniref:7-carboxy-7-deazaguanine synthase n=1 Tax=hydrothermal vent metagenome TaxID=652676 RepID=A0A3B0QWI8_9ZZZZ
MVVSEIFLSIQGESTYAGMPCIFIRLSGCNLDCNWCDTEYAKGNGDGKKMTVDEAVVEVGKFKAAVAEITGGEPLLQPEAKELAAKLVKAGYTVLIETNGSVALDGLPEEVVKIVDVKCPGSGHDGSFLMENLKYISPKDELKFVLAGREDYEFAKQFVEEEVKDLTSNILFAPVKPRLEPSELAAWILRDGIMVRLQPQLHSYIWDEEPR